MIKLFVFDLGNVILPFEHRQIAGKLLARSGKSGTVAPGEMFRHLFDLEKGSINAFEEGLISSGEFFAGLKARYDLDMGFDDFACIWNEIFREDRGVADIILDLKSRGYPLFLLSNTNELHFSYITGEYPIVHTLDEWILSFEVGAKKPDARIYEAIFEKMPDVKAEEVFYIDDVEDYVKAAQNLGIRGTVFKSAEQLREVLKTVTHDE